MIWIVKSLTQKIISFLPWRYKIYYLIQKYISKRLPCSDEKFLEICRLAQKHIDQIKAHYKKPLEQCFFFEFGAGWDLIIPLTFKNNGVKQQFLIDIQPLLRKELVSNTLEKFKLIKNTTLNTKTISYYAPIDAKKTGFRNNFFDIITNTNVIEHIHKNDIPIILQESYRILKPGGLISIIIDLQDHYANFDKTISIYNFLKFNRLIWNLFFNSSLHYQNRLRSNDYKLLIEKTNFKILSFESSNPTNQEKELLQKIKVNKFLKTKGVNNLGCKQLYILLQK